MPHAIRRRGLPRCETLLGAVGAVALHALGAWVVLEQPVTRQPPAPVAVLEASLLSAPAAPAAPPSTPASPPIADAPPPPAQPPAATQPAAVTRQPAQARPAPAKPARTKPAPVETTTEQPAPSQPRRPRAVAPVAEPSIAEPSTAPPAATSPAATPATPAQPRATQQEVMAKPPVTTPRFDAAYLNNPAPTYPPLSRRLGEQGRVLIRVYVDPNGEPAQVELRQSSGHRRLDAAAEAAVRRWRFVPARRGQEPVGAWVLVPIAFKLRS